jgi:hypothetical protein
MRKPAGMNGEREHISVIASNLAHSLVHPTGVMGHRVEELRRLVYEELEAKRPDLLTSVPESGPDREALLAIHDELLGLQCHGETIWVTGCEYEPGPRGYLAVAVVRTDVRRDVRAKDPVAPGLAIQRIGDSEVQVWSRPYRFDCTNGLVRHRMDRASDGERAKRVRHAVGRGLGDETADFDQLIFRHAAQEFVHDPSHLLAMLPDPRVRAQVACNWRNWGDLTAWGLANAVTGEARLSPSLRERFALEAAAGDILDLASRPSPDFEEAEVYWAHRLSSLTRTPASRRF